MLEFNEETNKVLAILHSYLIYPDDKEVKKLFFHPNGMYEKRKQYTGEITSNEFDIISQKLANCGFLSSMEFTNKDKSYSTQFVERTYINQQVRMLSGHQNRG